MTQRLDSIPAIILTELLQRYGSDSGHCTGQEAARSVEATRQRESTLRRYLPPQIVRRLDTNFARSCTVHPDTGHALYAVCRAMRAQHVFETGTYWGYSTAYLAAAVRDNGSGCVHTFDIDPRAGKHLPADLAPYIRKYLGQPSTDLMPAVLRTAVPQLFFQDSRHDYDGVAEELKVVAPVLPLGGIILLHDFVASAVRQAAVDSLPGYALYVLDAQDPQQLGVAVKVNG